MRKTPLVQAHEKQNGKMVDFAGWWMPIQYSGILEEHKAVRERVGLFDLSHMGEFRVEGSGALSFLQNLVTNDVAKIVDGQALYTPMCHEKAGMVDDILIYRLNEKRFFCVVNAANIDKDWAHFQKHKVGDVTLENESEATALIAVQGPKAEEMLKPLTEVSLDKIGYYHFTSGKVAGRDAVVSRTGYTGEDGFELFVKAEDATPLWETLLEAGKPHNLLPCGLGARDTLRLEAAFRLYGNDMDDTVTPYEAGLGWTVKLEKGAFIGREALVKEKDKGSRRKTIGVEVEGSGIPRHGFNVSHNGAPAGKVSSGTFSPTLKKNIALLLVRSDLAGAGHDLDVEIRGKNSLAKKVPLPFYKRKESVKA